MSRKRVATVAYENRRKKTRKNPAAECPCPHGEYGKSVEHHLQKMGSPDPAHDLKHSNDYVGRCQAGGIDPGMCAAVIYGAVHHHHPPSSHMTEAREVPSPKPGEVWFNPHSKTLYEILGLPDDSGWVNVRDMQTGEVSRVSIRTHLQQYGWHHSGVNEDKAAFRWAEVWFEHVADGALFVSRIEKVDSTIVADLSGHVVTTNATEHDVDKVLAKGGYKERFVKMDSVRRAAEEPVRWWLVVFSQLNGERGEIHVRARTADDALAKAQQDAQIDLSKQVRTIQLKSGARPDLSMGGPSPHAYEDFVAVDATGKVIGHPHKEYYRAKQEAGATGFVKYVSPTTLEANDSAVSENTWLVVVRGVGTEDTGIPHVISSHKTEREAERARKTQRDRSAPYSGDQLFDIAKKLPDGQIKIMPPSQLREDSAPACQPFTRVERDPVKFNACMLRAKEVGPIQGSRKIYDLVHADIEKLDEEHFLVLCLDFRGQVRDYVEINVGQRHRVATEVEDILRPIILSGCDGAVVIHNHPSGDAHPSEADDKLTDSIREAMRIACPGITLVDHVVIGRGQFHSYADKKLHKV